MTIPSSPGPAAAPAALVAGATGNADMRGLVQTLADAGVQRLVLLSGSSAEDGDPGNAVSEYVAGFSAGPPDGNGVGRLKMPLGDDDERHLRRAIELAGAARAAGDMLFGSTLVGPTGEVLAEDRNTVLTDRDITAHPELKLARWAGRHLPPDVARETTMYTSCQPCPMCAGAIARSGLGRVVFALSGEQLQALRPPGSLGPDAAEVRYDGPALHDEARGPVDGYYG